jgi:hypothetical protein
MSDLVVVLFTNLVPIVCLHSLMDFVVRGGRNTINKRGEIPFQAYSYVVLKKSLFARPKGIKAFYKEFAKIPIIYYSQK